jgi:hypothetical protein
MTWTLRLNDASPSQNILDRMHWTERRQIKAEWHYRIRSSKGFLQIPKATGPRRLTVERHSRGTLDTSNLIGGAKGIIDNLVELGLFLDDNPARLHLELPVQHKLKRGEHPHTILIIEDMEEVAA